MADIRIWPSALLGIFVLTALRVIALYFAQIDLFVDESQYWLWGENLDFGYYSKPPLIGWVIRAATELADSDADFWIRLPAPLFHAATAVILGMVAKRYISPSAGAVVALGYLTLPMVAVGSTLISTDTIMFPFLAAALGCYLRYFETRSSKWFAFAGALVGCAFMAKYAAMYFAICAALSAGFLKEFRPSFKAVGFGIVAFLIVISPNVFWNIANGFSTAQHTLDNADWVRDPGEKASLNIIGLVEFFAAQLAVLGPVLFVLFIMLLCGAFKNYQPHLRKLLILFSAPILVIVCLQAVLSQAYANWAATTYIAASLLVLPLLLHHKKLLILSFAVNGIIALALPTAVLTAQTFSLNGDQLILGRYINIKKMSFDIEDLAERHGQTLIVAQNRDILADLFHTLRDQDVKIRSTPPKGRAANHYALSFALSEPYPTDTMLLILGSRKKVPCETREIGRLINAKGHYRGREYTAYLAPSACFKR